MKTHTNAFKENIKKFGKEIKSKITYMLNDEEIVLTNEDFDAISPHYEGSILKSVMKQLDLTSNVYIPKDTTINYQFGVKVRDAEGIDDGYDYVNFGNYIVAKEPEKQEDMNKWKITCYDKMLLMMTPYEKMAVEYPITIKNYINVICTHKGIIFRNINDEFVNYDKVIENELFLDNEGNDLNYTFRDVMDQLAQVTASTICINEETDELEIRYLNETNDTIDEEYLKDVNVNFAEQYGPLNTIVLSRSAGSDKIALSRPENLSDDNKIAIEISDNQIMNFNNRDEYLPEILNELYGLQYYTNDFKSPGIVYYNLCDKYNINIDENTYECIMLNDDVSVTQGLEENVFTNLLEESKPDYTKVSKTDRTISQTTLIVDKQERNIEALVYDMYDDDGIINESFTQIRQDINGIVINAQNSGGGNLLLNSVMFLHSDDEIPSWEITGTGTIDINDSPEAKLAGGIAGHVFTLNNLIAKQRISVKVDNDNIDEENKTYYSFSTKIKKDTNGTCYVKIYNNNEEYRIVVNQGATPYFADYEITGLLPKDTYYDIEFYGSADSNATFTDNMFTIGRYKAQWQQATGEIMNTQVSIDTNGINVKSATSEGTEVVITPYEFSGYANVGGTKAKTFTLNGATTEVEKIKSRSEISMPPLKIVPINSGSKLGWAFVPTAGGDN